MITFLAVIGGVTITVIVSLILMHIDVIRYYL